MLENLLGAQQEKQQEKAKKAAVAVAAAAAAVAAVGDDSQVPASLMTTNHQQQQQQQQQPSLAGSQPWAPMDPASLVRPNNNALHSTAAPVHSTEFQAWEHFGKMAQAAMAPKVETQTVMLTERSARNMQAALRVMYEEQGIKHDDEDDDDGGGGGGGEDNKGAATGGASRAKDGTADWLKQVMTGGGLKAPSGGLYLDLEDGGDRHGDNTGGGGVGGDSRGGGVCVPSTVEGNDEWEKFPERRPKPRVPASIHNGGPFAATRMSLPVYEFRRELLGGIDANRVTIVEGDTGCGKTTQVPQYVLEEAASRGEPVYVMCTQPRRISAMGVAVGAVLHIL